MCWGRELALSSGGPVGVGAVWRLEVVVEGLKYWKKRSKGEGLPDDVFVPRHYGCCAVVQTPL